MVNRRGAGGGLAGQTSAIVNFETGLDFKTLLSAIINNNKQCLVCSHHNNMFHNIISSLNQTEAAGCD